MSPTSPSPVPSFAKSPAPLSAVRFVPSSPPDEGFQESSPRPLDVASGGRSTDPTLAALADELDGSGQERESIGPYRLLKVLGHGGMGVVHLAEQRHPVERRLALKLIRSSLIGGQANARFDAERRAMARLSHPNIAQIYDAGTTDDGIPYFAMEVVDGTQVTRFCDQRRATIDERLRLFVDVCRGVQHAHQRGIIHRDIKPSNVLVTDRDGQATPKIIDFGIAKALDGRLGGETQWTGDTMLGTPAYMSPESMTAIDAGQGLDIRTDVYALGILLYEMLTGRLPFDLAGLGQVQAVARILEGQAPRPTARVRGLGRRAGRIAAARGLTADRLEHRLRGDLDWIVTKATAWNRDERYGSVAGLIADLERHLRHQPVSVGPPSVAYRLGKLVRRHQTAVVGASVAALVVTTAIASAGVGFVRARDAEAEARTQAARAMQAEDRARAEAASAHQVVDLLVDLFEVADPVRQPGGDRTARELLDRGVRLVEKEHRDDPPVRAALLATLGEIHRKLGLYEDAESLLAESLRVHEALGSGESIAAARPLTDLGITLWRLGRLDDAEALLLRAQTIRDQHPAADHPERATTLRGLASVYREQGRLDEAAALDQRSSETDAVTLPTISDEPIAIVRGEEILSPNQTLEHEARAVE